ncbi:hypothetical protein Tco_1561493 [Tanacetum coccineum]
MWISFLTINDFLDRSSLSGWSGQGYMACPTCNKNTPSELVLGKKTYVCHIRFIKKNQKWKRSLIFNGKPEGGDPPRKFKREDILTQLDRLTTREKGKHPCYGCVKIKRNPIVELNRIEALPDIIPVDADDDFIDDEDDVPYDLVDYDDEVLANADDYDDEAATVVFLMSAAITRDHGGDGGGNDLSRPVRLASVFEEAEKPRQGRRQGWMKEGGACKPTRTMSTHPSYPASATRIHMKAYGRREGVCPTSKEMIKLRDIGANTLTGVPYTEEEILALVIKGK